MGGGKLTSIEICAGAGGQAQGLHSAGFRHLVMVEIDKHAAGSLKENVRDREGWLPGGEEMPSGKSKASFGQVLERDVNDFKPFQQFEDLEEEELGLLAGGVPCPPFSMAGKQLGQDDERDLFPRMIELVDELRPRAVLIENVRGLLQPPEKFAAYRAQILDRLDETGYAYCGWEVLEAADFGVPQLRPRALLVMIRKDVYRGFDWPTPQQRRTTVFEALDATMRERYGIDGPAPGLDTPALRARAEDCYRRWAEKAQSNADVAPTLVGGSKKHGGADLGPTRAKRAWAAHGINGLGVANDKEKPDLERDLLGEHGPMLTVEQAAIIQGFPADWKFTGGKTARYRQVGNAFPPPVAKAVGLQIAEALSREGELQDAPALPHRLPPASQAASVRSTAEGRVRRQRGAAEADRAAAAPAPVEAATS